MPDVRLIDANALKALFLRFHQETDLLDADWFTPYLFVKDAETIDAVKVVRCRECKHSDSATTPDGQVYCVALDEYFPDDGFCHMGEKMDGGAESV